jgi:hypothetical protein
MTARKICFGVVSVCSAASALAADQFTLSGGGRLELHDNAPLLEDKESDLVRVASVEVGYKKPEGALTADVNYRAERSDYLHETQGNENSIDGNTALVWHAIPKRLDAMLYHQISQQVTDRRGLDVTNNREERSIVTAGVDGFLNFSPVDSLKLSPRFADVNFERSDDSNSQHSTLAANLIHKLSPLSELNLNGNYDHVTFDESSNDYDAQGLMIGYSAALARLSYNVGVGYNRVNRDEGDNVSGSMYRLGFDYHDEEGSRWGATYAHQLTDSSIGFSGIELSNTDFQANDSNFTQPSTVEKSQADIFYEQPFSASSTLRLGAGYLKDDYKEILPLDTPVDPDSPEQSAQDQSVEYVSAGYQYRLNSYWALGLDARFDRTKFLEHPDNLRYDTIRTYATVTYTPLRKLALSLSVGRDKRDASQSSASYTDNVGILGLKYQFF